MKLTLLEIVQLLMSDADSDEINSISDTPESQQVARIVKESYLDIISRSDLPEHHDFFQLTASGNVNRPCLMFMPSSVVKIDFIRYNNHDSTDSNSSNPDFKEVQFLNISEFSERMFRLNSHSDNVDETTFNNAIYMWTTDKFPQFYSTIDDYTLIFDSFRDDLETTLEASKTQCYGEVEPTFTMDDSFIPSLNSKQFSLLVQEAKSQYFLDLKETQNPKAEARARKGWLNMQRRASISPDPWQDTLPNYGRKTASRPSLIPKNLRNGT